MLGLIFLRTKPDPGGLRWSWKSTNDHHSRKLHDYHSNAEWHSPELDFCKIGDELYEWKRRVVKNEPWMKLELWRCIGKEPIKNRIRKTLIFAVQGSLQGWSLTGELISISSWSLQIQTISNGICERKIKEMANSKIKIHVDSALSNPW
jgi:hypothetical protein